MLMFVTPRMAVSCSPLYDPLRGYWGPTHTLTHTGKGAGGQGGQCSAEQQVTIEKTAQKSTLSGAFDGSRAVGKDEVPGPNPGSSSKIAGFRMETSDFLFYS